MKQFLEQFAQLSTTLTADIKGNPEFSLRYLADSDVFVFGFIWIDNSEEKIKSVTHRVAEVPAWMTMDEFSDHLVDTINKIYDSYENNK